MTNYNLPTGRSITTYPCSTSNQITKDYYNFLVGEINRGTMFKALCKVTNTTFGTESYYLISER